MASILLNEPTPAPGSGMTPDELKSLWAELGENHLNHRIGDYATAIGLLRDAHKLARETGLEASSDGVDWLLERPEFADVEKLRALVRAFEDKQRLLDLLDRTLAAGGVQVLIGKETNLGEVDDLTVISASSPGGGTLGVIAPTRIDYRKVVPLVGYTATLVGDLLERTDDDETEHD